MPSISAIPKVPTAGGNASATVRCHPNRHKTTPKASVKWDCLTPDHECEIRFAPGKSPFSQATFLVKYGTPQNKNVTGAPGAYHYTVKIRYKDGTLRGTLDPFVDVG